MRFLLSISNRRFSAKLRRLWRALAHEGGNAVAELAVGVTFLLAPVLLGTTELGYMIYNSIEISNAAHAGALYASHSTTYAADTADIQAVARAEANDIGSNLTVTTTTYFVCSGAITGTQYSTQALAAAVCPSSSTTNHYLLFVKVTTSAPVASPVSFPWLASSWTLTGSSIMEVPLS